MYNQSHDSWAGVLSGLGLACICVSAYTAPAIETVKSVEDMGSVSCALRTAGGIVTFNVNVMVPVGALVFACDWLLVDTAGQTIRGCPVPRGNGSPFGVALKTTAGVILMAGASLEISFPNPERYLRSRDKISALVLGFYCTKRPCEMKGGVYHVRSS